MKRKPTIRAVMFGLALMFITSACTPEEIEWWTRGQSTEDQHAVMEHIAREAAQEFGISGDLLVAISTCESGLNPGAVNKASGATGPMQYLRTTWAKERFRLYDRGLTDEPYAMEDIVNPRAVYRTAANAIAEGGIWWLWAESARCWRWAY